MKKRRVDSSCAETRARRVPVSCWGVGFIPAFPAQADELLLARIVHTADVPNVAQVVYRSGGEVHAVRGEVTAMDWMQQLGGVLNQYAAGTGDHAAAERDFDQVAQAAPRHAVAEGLADAFRSPQTAPFPQMLSQLFGQSGGTQRAGVLNALLTTLGPAVLSQVLSRRGVPGAEHVNGQRTIPPDVAQQIPQDAVEELAREAEQKDPSVIDRLGHLYADQPGIVKTLGGAALVIAMAKVAQAQTRR